MEKERQEPASKNSVFSTGKENWASVVNSAGPRENVFKYLIVGIAFIMLIVSGVSFSNRNTYQIKSLDGAIEIWQGKFAPMGSRKLITLPGGIPPEKIKHHYDKDDVFPIICNYYLDRSDALLDVRGMPDFESIGNDLEKALAYATTKALKAAVRSRINTIDVMVLLYKADVAASSNKVTGLKQAKSYLKKARALELDKDKTDIVEKKLLEVQHLLKSLKKESSRQANSK